MVVLKWSIKFYDNWRGCSSDWKVLVEDGAGLGRKLWRESCYIYFINIVEWGVSVFIEWWCLVNIEINWWLNMF